VINKCLIDDIVSNLGPYEDIIKKKILIGKETYIESYIIFVEGLVDITAVEAVVSRPLMEEVDEKKLPSSNVLEFLCQKYIVRGNAIIEVRLEKIIDSINHGSTCIIIDGYSEVILVNTKGGEFRSITEPVMESPLRGNREGFVESVEVNISLVKRLVRDQNLKIEMFKIGRRSKTDVALMYIEDIMDEELLKEVRDRVSRIDVSVISSSGFLEQFIEDTPNSPFPQMYGTEKPDKVVTKLMEGRFALIVAGTPYVITAPSVFQEFMQASEDYNQRTITASFIRLTRYIAIIFVMLLGPLYLTLISYNLELIPISFITPIAQSRQGVPLSPFLEILFMEFVVEFMREGGLRLPPKIATTISIVGGIIIGNAAIQARVVSPTTLLIVGVTTIASFLIPNYEMAITIRLLRFPMLILADALGFLGIAVGCFLILAHLFWLKSFNVPYFTFTRHDMQDLYIRTHLWKMNRRPDAIPMKDYIRQTDRFKGKGEEE
jgi:spore germination protein KA